MMIVNGNGKDDDDDDCGGIEAKDGVGFHVSRLSARAVMIQPRLD